MVSAGRLMLALSVVAALGVAGGHSSANGPGTQLWVQRYHGPGKGNDGPSALVVSPGGRRIFVTGNSHNAAGGYGYGTIAYDADSGRQLWFSQYGDQAASKDSPRDVAASADGQRVYVSGKPAVIAYNANTGAQLWVRRMNGQNVAVSPNGKTLFVLGAAATSVPTVALDAATGQQLWKRTYHGPGGCPISESIAVAPTGNTVFVTGICPSVNIQGDYATVAYDAITGKQLWVSRYNGPGNNEDVPQALAVSPDGGTVYVTGASQDANSIYAYATVAYNATTGDQLWVSRYEPAGSSYNAANSIVVSPAGNAVFVTGNSQPAGRHDAIATIAYDATTGVRLWSRVFDRTDSGTGGPQGLTVTAKTVYLAGGTVWQGAEDYLLLAYNATTGVERWLRLYNPYRAERRGADASSVAVSPATGAVFITGSSWPKGAGSDFATIAYHG